MATSTIVILFLLWLGASHNKREREEYRRGYMAWAAEEERKRILQRDLQRFSALSAQTAELLEKVQQNPDDAYLLHLALKHNVPDTFPEEWAKLER